MECSELRRVWSHSEVRSPLLAGLEGSLRLRAVEPSRKAAAVNLRGQGGVSVRVVAIDTGTESHLGHLRAELIVLSVGVDVGQGTLRYGI